MEEVKYTQEEDQGSWRSCCLRTDRQAVVYLGQLIFSLSVLGICTMMLVLADGNCEKSSGYISMISFLAGRILSQVIDSTHR